MLDTSRSDDRAVAYFQLCADGNTLVLDWEALTSRAGLNIVALAALGLDETARETVRQFIKRPARDQIPALLTALRADGARFNAQTRKDLVDAIERSVAAG